MTASQPSAARRSLAAPRILVVGGVAGGASAAARARRMNEHAEIIIFERDSYVSFANCGLPYYLGGEIQDRNKLLIAKPALFLRRSCIEVRTRHEVRAIDRVAKTILRLQKDGLVVRSLDARISAAALCAMVEGFARHWLSAGDDGVEPLAPDARALRTLNELWARALGLTAPGGS